MIVRVIEHTSDMCFGYGLFTKGVIWQLGYLQRGLPYLQSSNDMFIN
jgi:hypothetical protein